ncbi:MAG: quinone-dependent dihydroorotate dehydrogenase [Fimbriimonadaceae bacterium]
MGLWRSVLRPILFRLDPETAHNLGMWAIRNGLVRVRPFRDGRLAQRCFGCDFPNPIGLAAGFDKDGTAIGRWQNLGFGFAEVGTITNAAQPGNPKPRLFRLPEDEALINRMGFNNAGARAAARRIGRSRADIPIGINIGKSKAADVDQAAADYAACFERLHALGQYFVVNVSSPNTPNLRNLQDADRLLEILLRLKQIDRDRPMFVKVAPDLALGALDDVVRVAHDAGLTGIVATNTTISREGLRRDPNEAGGLSGRPLAEVSNRFLDHLRRSCDRNMILIGVGGVFSGADVFEKIARGAHLVQIYTGWVYGGPAMVPRALAELLGLLEKHGLKNLDQLRGSGLRP